ncbi:hypothetical protein C8A05DRAFT_20183 [Staphylotrichum tortipilum]|uniref:Uncharacterized protein n=1 Tax=Staphylotrichum tortipilum TaxID=2831512 RepID=A0AAN6RNU9_9PEZI|nr:hypothetical protein C8A05DRAFT_20183 [Staphylotrichum longicolle]
MNFARPENCPVCAEFVASLFQSAQARHDHDPGESWLPGIWATTRCLRAALPPGYVPVPTDPQLVELYLRLRFGADRQLVAVNVTSPILETCLPDVCRALGWQGNGDLSGIGVFTSFTIEAVLATLYLVALGAPELGRSKGWWPMGRSRRVAVLDRLHGAFAATLPGFRSAAAFFCSALTVAALAVVIEANRHPDETTSYEVLTATLVCVISVFPVVLLNALECHERPPIFHRGIMMVLLALAFIQVNMSENVRPEQAVLDSGGMADSFMVYCPVSQGPIFQAVTATYVLYLVGGFAALVFDFSYKKRGLDRYAWAVRLKTHWRLVAAVPCMLVMWVYFGLYQHVRADVLDRAGPTNRDNQWTFGQFVAVLAWVPVVTEFGYRLKCKP